MSFLAGCQRAAPPVVDEPAPRPSMVPVAPPPARVEDAGVEAGTCGPDIATRLPGAVAVDGVDLDGDGRLEAVFRSREDGFFGNAEFVFYDVAGPCAVYLGKVTAFFVNTPHCVGPSRGRWCRLAANRRMYHDDFQETFYEHDGETFREVGRGRHIPGRPGK